ncbi:MAG: rRNA maturation RNase YbeY [Planctomycetota bacterium]
MSATVVDQQTAIPRAKAACKRAAELVLTKKVVVALVDDPTMAELHERFLGKQGPTDVLSFPHGEIVVSADTAAREAKARGIPPLHELVLYVVHGALHLAGYEDRSPKAARRMRQAERKILDELGYGDVFGTPIQSKGRPPRGGPKRKFAGKSRPGKKKTTTRKKTSARRRNR